MMVSTLKSCFLSVCMPIVIVILLVVFWTLSNDHISLYRGNFPFREITTKRISPAVVKGLSELDPLSKNGKVQSFQGHTSKNDFAVPHPLCQNVLYRKRRKHHVYDDHVPNYQTWKDSLDITNATHTTYNIVWPKRENFTHFVVCDVLEIFIIARNGRNERKKHGGDYFRAKIFTRNSTFSASSSTDGEVLDHGNGTYSAFFTIKWAGDIQIEVILVHPSEAVQILRKFQIQNTIRESFIGLFHGKDPQTSETTSCNIRLKEPPNMKCNFTDKRTGGPWFCIKPRNFTCSNWKGHRQGGKYLTPFINDANGLPFKEANQKIRGVARITVPFNSGNNSVVQSGAIASLPPCLPRVQFGQPDVAGFYWNNHFHSPHCLIRPFTRQKAEQTLRNKSIYIFGDSTIRQLFQQYCFKFNLKRELLHKSDDSYLGPQVAKYSKINMTLLFHFHAIPIRRAGNWSKVANLKYVANMIDDIKGGRDTVVIMSLWAHFAPFPPWLYEQRVRSVLGSVRRLLKRSPKTLVIWKSANTREHMLLPHFLKYSDWLARDLDRRMRNQVFNYGYVGFLDAWDMTNAQFNEPDVHPTGPHVENLSRKVLTYISNHDLS